jgi:hypothetical protein
VSEPLVPVIVSVDVVGFEAEAVVIVSVELDVAGFGLKL